MSHWPLFIDEETFHSERELKGDFEKQVSVSWKAPCGFFTALSLPDL